MARRRMIDPGIWQSEQVNSLDFRQRWLYAGLISNADDYGKMKGHPAWVRSQVFPYDDIPVEEIKTDLCHMAKIGLIYYWQNGDNWLIQHPNWFKYQRVDKPTESLLPDHPDYHEGTPPPFRTVTGQKLKILIEEAGDDSAIYSEEHSEYPSKSDSESESKNDSALEFAQRKGNEVKEEGKEERKERERKQKAALAPQIPPSSSENQQISHTTNETHDSVASLSPNQAEDILFGPEADAQREEARAGGVKLRPPDAMDLWGGEKTTPEIRRYLEHFCDLYGFDLPHKKSVRQEWAKQASDNIAVCNNNLWIALELTDQIHAAQEAGTDFDFRVVQPKSHEKTLRSLMAEEKRGRNKRDYQEDGRRYLEGRYGKFIQH